MILKTLNGDNVPTSHYDGIATPAQVPAQLEVANSEDQETVSAEVNQSFQGKTEGAVAS